MWKKIRKWCIDIVVIIVACFIYSFTLRYFTVPNDIAPGGVTGVATIISSMTNFSIGILYGLLNLPLVVIGFIFLGHKMMIKTITAVLVITFAADFLFIEIQPYGGDKIIAAIFGGLLLGIGLGLVYLREGTTGGIDIINRIIYRKIPHLSLGQIMIFADAVVIAAAMLVFNSIESGLYAVITIFVSGRVVDLLLYGSLEGKLLLIFSDEYVRISERIMKEHKRGVTLLNGTGAYSGNEKKIICCAVQKNQYVKIKRIVSQIDENAFLVIANAGEVLGKGFGKNIML